MATVKKTAQDISIEFALARRTKDYSSIYYTMLNDIRIVNRRIGEFIRAGVSDYYHIKAIQRIGSRLNILNRTGTKLSVNVDTLATLDRKSLKELALEVNAFRYSRTGTVKSLLSSDSHRIDTLLQNSTILSKGNGSKYNITVNKFRDMLRNETVQRALAKHSGVISDDVIDDYMTFLDNDDLDVNTFLQRLEDYLNTDDKYATYRDYLAGNYTKN